MAEAGLRQRLPHTHTHAHRADSDRWREGVNPLRYKVFRDNYSQLGRTSPNGLGFKAAIFSSIVGTFNVNEPVCRLCLKTVATKRGNTTNLKSHLKHNHPTQFFNLGTTTAAGAGEGSSRQLSVTDAFSRQCKYKRDSAKWRTLTDSVTRYIAKEMQPLNTVEKPAFKNMLQTFLFLRIKCSLFFERVHLHYYAIILSYCNYIISEIKLS